MLKSEEYSNYNYIAHHIKEPPNETGVWNPLLVDPIWPSVVINFLHTSTDAMSIKLYLFLQQRYKAVVAGTV